MEVKCTASVYICTFSEFRCTHSSDNKRTNKKIFYHC